MNQHEQDILSRNRGYVTEIEHHIRPTSNPIGIKFYHKGSAIPDDIELLEDSVTICQATTLARVSNRNRKPFLVTKENMCCAFAGAAVGFTGWPKDIMSGDRDVGVHFSTYEGFRRALNNLPHMPADSVEAIAMGPLYSFHLEPDIVFFALMPGQVNRFTDGYVWHKGGYITVNFSGMCGVCSNGVVKTLTDKTAVLSFPCFGGRRVGLYQDSELIAGVHIEFIDDWLDGLKKTEATGHTYPNTVSLPIDTPGLPHYKIIEWPDVIVPAKSTELEEDS